MTQLIRIVRCDIMYDVLSLSKIANGQVERYRRCPEANSTELIEALPLTFTPAAPVVVIPQATVSPLVVTFTIEGTGV